MAIANINHYISEARQKLQDFGKQLEDSVAPVRQKIDETITGLSKKIAEHSRHIADASSIDQEVEVLPHQQVESQLRAVCRLILRVVAVSCAFFIASILPVFTLATVGLIGYALYKGAESAEALDRKGHAEHEPQTKDKLVATFAHDFWHKGICPPLDRGIEFVASFLKHSGEDLLLSKNFAITLSNCRVSPTSTEET